MKKQSVFQFVRKYFMWLLLLFFTVLCAYVCFARLDVGLIQHWDEARHGVNAYEMMKNHNYIVNTYNYANDYFNLKPPLSYWGIILGFRLFGTGVFGMRFYSALAAFATFLLIAVYLLRRYGKTAALCSMAIFLTFYDFFYWHAARNADADAVYILFFTIGCLALIESAKRPHLLWICGLMFSLCFLSKSWHACVLLPIGGLFWLFSGLCRRMKPRHYIGLFSCAILPIALWAFARYQYDGMAFLGQMFGVDVTQRIAWSESSNPNYFFFLNYLLHSRAVLVMLGTIAFAVLFALLMRHCNAPVQRQSAMKCRFRERALPAVLGLTLWILVPVLVFSLSHTYYYWYVYPIFPALCLAASILVQLCRNACRTESNWPCSPAFSFFPPWLPSTTTGSRFPGSTIWKSRAFSWICRPPWNNVPICTEWTFMWKKSDNEYKESFYWSRPACSWPN